MISAEEGNGIERNPEQGRKKRLKIKFRHWKLKEYKLSPSFILFPFLSLPSYWEVLEWR
jgi:hypothetical protein